EPLDEGSLAVRLPEGVDVPKVLLSLQQSYQARGVNLVNVAGKWAFRTAPDLAHLLLREVQAPRRLSRAAVETLAIIAYHQPTTRADIEEIRGVSISRGTLDLLMETGWIRIAGRRRTPGRPVTYGITDAFLEHFGLEDVKDLPGVKELKAAGLLDSSPPLNFHGSPADNENEDSDAESDEDSGLEFSPDLREDDELDLPKEEANALDQTSDLDDEQT
ncbi:MAG: SMC-Scp complex subunit ScpB, partial [Rhodospirillales bacterium]|nr:SMC-Scp complex subunit ScpB [Rhodospirillales bacterium]